MSANIEMELVPLPRNEDDWDAFSPGIPNLKVYIRPSFGQVGNDQACRFNAFPDAGENVPGEVSFIDSFTNEVAVADGRVYSEFIYVLKLLRKR